jgi:phage baseplate assembly protein W
MRNRPQFSINPIDTKRDVAVGILLPFGTDRGLFKQSYTTEQQAISNLKSLLLTRKGERLFQPEFGTDIYSILFEQMTAATENDLTESLISDIEFWLPYIIIDKLNVSVDNDRNSILIKLSVRVSETGANTEIIILVQSNGGIEIL